MGRYLCEKLCTLVKPIAVCGCAMWVMLGGARHGSPAPEVMHSQSACTEESLLSGAAVSSVDLPVTRRDSNGSAVSSVNTGDMVPIAGDD